MELLVRGNGITISDELRAFAEKRTAKLDRLLNRVVDAKLELRYRRQRSGPDTVIAQLTIQTGRHLLRAEESDPDALVAIDRVVDTAGRQVRRFHERKSDRKGPRPEVAAAVDEAELETEIAGTIDDVTSDDEERLAHLVRTKRFSVKPMDVDEAIEQMELLGHDFFLFHNADDETLNVVYRRRDGAFGLLAPDRA